jgi:hypothetical protein
MRRLTASGRPGLSGSLVRQSSSTWSAAGCRRTPTNVPLPVVTGRPIFFLAGFFTDFVLAQRRAEGKQRTSASSLATATKEEIAMADSLDTTNLSAGKQGRKRGLNDVGKLPTSQQTPGPGQASGFSFPWSIFARGAGLVIWPVPQNAGPVFLEPLWLR